MPCCILCVVRTEIRDLIISIFVSETLPELLNLALFVLIKFVVFKPAESIDVQS